MQRAGSRVQEVPEAPPTLPAGLLQGSQGPFEPDPEISGAVMEEIEVPVRSRKDRMGKALAKDRKAVNPMQEDSRLEGLEGLFLGAWQNPALTASMTLAITSTLALAARKSS